MAKKEQNDLAAALKLRQFFGDGWYVEVKVTHSAPANAEARTSYMVTARKGVRPDPRNYYSGFGSTLFAAAVRTVVQQMPDDRLDEIESIIVAVRDAIGEPGKGIMSPTNVQGCTKRQEC